MIYQVKVPRLSSGGFQSWCDGDPITFSSIVRLESKSHYLSWEGKCEALTCLGNIWNNGLGWETLDSRVRLTLDIYICYNSLSLKKILLRSELLSINFTSRTILGVIQKEKQCDIACKDFTNLVGLKEQTKRSHFCEWRTCIKSRTCEARTYISSHKVLPKHTWKRAAGVQTRRYLPGCPVLWSSSATLPWEASLPYVLECGWNSGSPLPDPFPHSQVPGPRGNEK